MDSPSEDLEGTRGSGSVGQISAQEFNEVGYGGKLGMERAVRLEAEKKERNFFLKGEKKTQGRSQNVKRMHQRGLP